MINSLMKYGLSITVAIVLCIFVCTTCTNATYADDITYYVYHNPNQTFSFELPVEWAQVDDLIAQEYIETFNKPETLEIYTKMIESSRQSKFFYLTNKQPFVYPYLYVREETVPESYRIEGLYEGMKAHKERDFKKAQEALNSLGVNSIQLNTLDTYSLDETRNMIFLTTEMNGNSVWVRTKVAFILGKGSLVTITFYSTREESDQWLPTFSSIIDSFKFEPEYQYNPESETIPQAVPIAQEPISNTSFDNNRSMLIIIKVIIGSLIGGLIVFFKKKKNKDEMDI